MCSYALFSAPKKYIWSIACANLNVSFCKPKHVYKITFWITLQAKVLKGKTCVWWNVHHWTQRFISGSGNKPKIECVESLKRNCEKLEKYCKKRSYVDILPLGLTFLHTIKLLCSIQGLVFFLAPNARLFRNWVFLSHYSYSAIRLRYDTSK